jgi:hypothetical protein
MAGYGRDSGECYASTTTLATTLFTVQRHVIRWLNELRAAGFIASRRVPGKPSHHVFLWHPLFAAAVLARGDNSVTLPLTPMSQGYDTGVTQMYRTQGVELTSSRGPADYRQAKGSVPQPRSSQTDPTTTPIFEAVKAEIWGYMTGESKTSARPPDDAIVLKCVAELHGHKTEELHLFLQQRFLDGYTPGSKSGPREYSWFVQCLHNRFSR